MTWCITVTESSPAPKGANDWHLSHRGRTSETLCKGKEPHTSEHVPYSHETARKRHVGKDGNWLCDCSKLGLGTGVGFGWAGGIDRFRGDGTIHAQTDAWCWSLHLVKLLTITELYTWQGRTLYCVKNSSSAAWIKSHTSWSPEDNGVLLDWPMLETLQWTEWRETLSSRCWRALLYPWQLYFEGPPVYFRGNQSVESYLKKNS